MTKSYISKGCNKEYYRDLTHTYEQTCRDYVSVAPCTFSDVRFPCETCNRNFRSHTYLDNDKKNKMTGKTVCEVKRNCETCGSLLTMKKHEYFKPNCENCNRNVEIGHLRNISTLKNEVPLSDKVLFIFYDF